MRERPAKTRIGVTFAPDVGGRSYDQFRTQRAARFHVMCKLLIKRVVEIFRVDVFYAVRNRF